MRKTLSEETRRALIELIKAVDRTVRDADNKPEGGECVEVSRIHIEQMRDALINVGVSS